MEKDEEARAFSNRLNVLEDELVKLANDLLKLNSKHIDAKTFSLGPSKDVKTFGPECIQLSLKILQDALILAQEIASFKKGCM